MTNLYKLKCLSWLTYYFYILCIIYINRVSFAICLTNRRTYFRNGCLKIVVFDSWNPSKSRQHYKCFFDVTPYVIRQSRMHYWLHYICIKLTRMVESRRPSFDYVFLLKLGGNRFKKETNNTTVNLLFSTYIVMFYISRFARCVGSYTRGIISLACGAPHLTFLFNLSLFML